MRNPTRLFGLLFCILALLGTQSVHPGPPTGIVVEPGIDAWTTPGGGSTATDFSATPLPADFFDPGSDPFVGQILFKGNTNALGNPAFGPVDTIVERQAPADLTGGCPTQDTIPIQIVALGLTSISPITVTYNGGQNP